MGTLDGIANVQIGHSSHPQARTGCTVILCPHGATAGVAVRGGAPGTRETDLLQPGNLVAQVHAILLTGGSAFGLAAADGVMRWLYERQIGFATAAANVPIVPAAVLFDLQPGAVAWPESAQGYQACEAAQQPDLRWGRVGAGSGATVGKLLGPTAASPGGIGAASLRLSDGTVVAAVVAVNALGHVINPHSGRIVAGPRLPDGSLADSIELMLRPSASSPAEPGLGQNTTIGCVITTARLDQAGCQRVASVAHDGLARTIRPAHTAYDGDTLFALSTAALDAPLADSALISVAAAEVVAQAVLNAVQPDRAIAAG